MVRIVETKLNTHACPHSCLLSDPFFDPNSKFVHVNDGLDNKCEKGAPITDVDACKAMAAKTNVPYRGEHRLVYGPTGCIFYNAMYATHSAKDAGIFFLHKNDRVQPMPVKGHFKVCALPTCGNGKFRNHNSKCVTCPTGATCDGVELISCAIGYFQTILKDACRKCPTDATCDGKIITTCGNGHRKGDFYGLSCAPCPTGATCDGKSHVVNCGAGKFAHNDDHTYGVGDACLTCPAGATCDGKSIVTCGDTRYKIESGDACGKCPAGATCDGKSITTCGSTDKFVNLDTCMQCVPGYTCDGLALTARNTTGIVTS